MTEWEWLEYILLYYYYNTQLVWDTFCNMSMKDYGVYKSKL